MNKLLVSLSFILINVTGFKAQNFSRGCEIENIDTNLIVLKKFPKTRGNIPSSYSLVDYAPVALSQGTLGSCTSWASAYCAFTIVKRIEASNTNILPFSALNLHNRLKISENENPCSDGNTISKSLSFLKTYGCSVYGDVCSFISSNSYYDDKLYDYASLSINTADFKQSISENCPIVFSAVYYKISDNLSAAWANASNLYNGVWNGNCSGIKDGSHAMTIVGYDDYKEGGSFLIQNSWGSDWGNNGRFWMKYRDINKVINFAFSLIPDFEEDDDDFDFNDDVNGDYFTVYNNCSLSAYISLSQFVDGNWETNGWYHINSGSSLNLDISNRTSNSFYWLATANKSNGEKIWWQDDINGTQMCYDKFRVHKIFNNSSPSCPDVAPFYQDNPSPGTVYHSRNLTCPNVSTRGGEIQIFTENSLVELSKEPIHLSNLNWDGNTALIDLMSGRIIEGIKDENGNEIFDIFIKKREKVKRFKGLKTKLIKIKGYKFQTKNNAINWELTE